MINPINIYYIYQLIDPILQLPFYIGKGKNNRLFSHEKIVKRGKYPNNNKHLYYKIKQILDQGLEVVYIKVEENLSEEDAWKLESDYEIKLRSHEIELCNLSTCGKGGNTWIYMTESQRRSSIEKLKASRPKTLDLSWRQNISKGLLGTKHSIESKRKRSEKLRGKNNPMYGKTFSLDVLEKIRMSSFGRKHTDSAKEKCRVARTGKTHTDEAKEKCRKAKLGKSLPEWVCEKMSKSHKGKKLSKEQVEKISKANRGKIRSDETKRKISDNAKLRVGSKNPNFKEISDENKIFIRNNLDKSINWIVLNLPIKMGRGRVVRFIREIS